MRSRRATIVTVGLCLAILVSSSALAKRKKAKQPDYPLDEGRLEMSYFADHNLPFVETDEIDYLWVKEGFSLDGHTLQFMEWPEPEFVGPDADERDAKDTRLARQMNTDMHRLFQETWADELKAGTMSLTDGDVVVEGRIVDCSTGSTAAKMWVGFGAGAGYTVIDLKLTDRASGELLVAMHHQVVSGTTWSTTDSKFVNWVEEAAEDVEDRGGFERTFQKGDPVDE